MSWETSTTSSKSLSYNRMPRPRSQVPFCASSSLWLKAIQSYLASQLECFDANKQQCGGSFGTVLWYRSLLSHSRMGLSCIVSRFGTTLESHEYHPFPSFSHLRFGPLEHPGGIPPHFQTYRSPRLSEATRRAPVTWLTSGSYGSHWQMDQRSGHSW